MASMGAPAEALALAYAGRASSKWPVVAEHFAVAGTYGGAGGQPWMDRRWVGIWFSMA